MPIPAHMIKVTCDNTKPLATISSIIAAGTGFSVGTIFSNVVVGAISLPHTLALTEILTVNYLIPGSAGDGSLTINSDDDDSPFTVNVHVTS